MQKDAFYAALCSQPSDNGGGVSVEPGIILTDSLFLVYIQNMQFYTHSGNRKIRKVLNRNSSLVTWPCNNLNISWI